MRASWTLLCRVKTSRWLEQSHHPDNSALNILQEREASPTTTTTKVYLAKNFCLTAKNAVDVRNMVRGRDDKINQLKFGAAKQQNTFLKRFQLFFFILHLLIQFFLAFAFFSFSFLWLSRSLFSFSCSFLHSINWRHRQIEWNVDICLIKMIPHFIFTKLYYYGQQTEIAWWATA